MIEKILDVVDKILPVRAPEVVLIVDTETTGLLATDRVIEIGGLLYSVKHQATIAQVSFLLPAESNAAERINRIPAALLLDMPTLHMRHSSDMLAYMMDEAEFFVAQSAEFDRGFLVPMDPIWDSRPWLCTKDDFQWPQSAKPGGSLVNVALEHGIGVGTAHRALTDCMLIAELFTRQKRVVLDEMFRMAQRPKFWFRARVDFAENGLAREAGFRWNPDRKFWERKMAEADTGILPFRTVRINKR
jgi:DNA polymerase III subunit epsilon